MPSLDLHPDALQLPRPLVNQLLHAAQIHPNRVHWGVISRHAGEPDRCDVLPDTTETLAHRLMQIVRENRQPWAWYYCDAHAVSLPDLAHLPQFKVPLLLTVSLGTKGVLQLRAWRIDGPEPIELEVSIHEL